MYLVQCRAPKGDTELLASMEQALPIHKDWLNFNRFSVRADKGIGIGPLKFWASAKGGAIVGDLPPYESFPLGGTNSIRGYGEGSVGSARNYIAGTAEVRFPIFSPLEGAVFGDYGTDLGSGASIPGDPAGCRRGVWRARAQHGARARVWPAMHCAWGEMVAARMCAAPRRTS